MARTLYLAAAGPETGKSAIALGIFDAISRRIAPVAVFRPVVRADVPDPVLGMLARQYDLPPGSVASGVTYDDVHADPAQAFATIVERFHEIEREHEAVLVVGSDYTDVGAQTELSFNAQVALNLGAPVLLVVNGNDRDVDQITTAVDVASAAITERGCELIGTVVNRVDPGLLDAAVAALVDHPAVSVVPEVPALSAPTMGQVIDTCHATLLWGAPDRLDKEVLTFLVAAMTLPRVLDALTDSALVIIAGDRSDMLLGVLTAHASRNFPRLAGILLSGGVEPEPSVRRLIDGLGNGTSILPIAVTPSNTFTAATSAASARGALTDGSASKADTALALIARHLDTTGLLDRLDVYRTHAVTPLMFEHDLVERARSQRCRIVLPEGTEPRIVQAAAEVLQRGIADVILLGDPARVARIARGAGVDIERALILDPTADDLRHRLAEEYTRLRKHKGVTLEMALDRVTEVSYAGSLMVALGMADGMVSGAAHTTAQTIRPVFEIIGTAPGVGLVSSIFFMCLADRVLVYGDCVVVPHPTADQLAEIAITSAATAAAFGIEPRVAMLSYSTGESGQGADVDTVRTATRLAVERAPHLQIEGPIQYDAATDETVAAAKLPGAALGGRATVLVFPDLDAGNTTYKAVQRTAGAVVVGPLLQGLRQPVNDLSRGATVRDIVTTIAMTAVQVHETTTP